MVTYWKLDSKVSQHFGSTLKSPPKNWKSTRHSTNEMIPIELRESEADDKLDKTKVDDKHEESDKTYMTIMSMMVLAALLQFQMRIHQTCCLRNKRLRKESKVNRILSRVQKSFWSCTHVNSCQNYTLYINLHILLNI